VKETFDLMSCCYTLEAGKPVVWLFGRNQAGRKVFKVRGFVPYFYIPAREKEAVNASRVPVSTSIFGEPVVRIDCTIPRDVPAERRKYEKHYEAAIPFKYRFLIDQGICDAFEVDYDAKKIAPAESSRIPPRIGYFDIEVDSPPEIMPVPEEPIYPIVCFSYMDSYTKKKHILVLKTEAEPVEGVEYFDSERELFFGFFKLVQRYDPDILTGWFSNFYDWPYIWERAKKLRVSLEPLSPIRVISARYPKERGRVDLRILGRELVDLLEWYRIITKPEGLKTTYDLKFIVDYETGFKFTDYGDRIRFIWKRDHKLLKTYMLNELEALVRVDRARDIIAEVDRRRRVVGVLPSDVHATTKCCLVFLHRISDKVLPTFTLQKGPEYRGALVADVEPGLYHNVAVYDIKSIYPSIIVYRNLSYETYRDGRFVPEPEGTLPRAVRILMEEREKLRKKRKLFRPGTKEYQRLWALEQSVKYHVNSFYGVQKYFMPEIAAEVTRTGRKIISALKQRIPEVIYFDTDSLFIKLKSNDWREGLKIEKVLRDTLRSVSTELGFKKPLSIRYESFFKTLYLHASKHYVGHVTMKDMKPADLTVLVGIVLKKSDTCLFSRNVARVFFRKLLKEGTLSAVKYLRTMKDWFFKVPLSRIAIPKGIGKKLHEYKKESPHVRGVKYAVKHLGFRFREDKRPLLVYVRGIPGHPPTDVVCFPDEDTCNAWADKVILDKRKQFLKAFKERFQPFLRDLHMSFEPVEQRRLLDAYI